MSPPAPAVGRALHLQAQNRTLMYGGILVAIAALLVTAIALTGYWHTLQSLKNDQRVVFVKLSPDGGWTIDPGFGPDIDFFVTTAEAILAEYVESCFSNDLRTIEAERAVCFQFQPESRQRAYLAKAREEVVETQDRPGRIERVRVRQFRHDTFIPTQYTGSQFTYESTAFATEYQVSDKVEQPLRRLVVDLTWRFRGREAIQANPAMLRINPLAIEVIDYSVAIDTVGDKS